MRVLYVDDIRKPIKWWNTDYEVYIAHNYKDTIHLLQKYEFDIIDLDHDLAEEKTGYDIAKYMVENLIKVKYVTIHTANSVGRFNMVQLLSHYGYDVIMS